MKLEIKQSDYWINRGEDILVVSKGDIKVHLSRMLWNDLLFALGPDQVESEIVEILKSDLTEEESKQVIVYFKENIK